MTEGTLLGGAVRYGQPAVGFRTGFEPVLLAAFVPARPAERVVEAGCGAGAGLLCLAARLPGVTGLGIERDPAQADLARRNLAANGIAGIEIVTGAVETWRPAAPFDHAMANPPWHDARGTPPAEAGRHAAKVAAESGLALWAGALAQALRRRGTLTLILPAGQLGAGVAALRGAGCGDLALLPLWPRAGQPARLLLLRGVRGGRGGDTLLPGLVLHGPEGLTAAAERCLRHGGGLPPAPDGGG